MIKALTRQIGSIREKLTNLYEFSQIADIQKDIALIDFRLNNCFCQEENEENMFNVFADKVFDWLSVVFVVIIVLSLLIGFWKGGMKTVFTIACMAGAIGLCFLLSKPIADALIGSKLGVGIDTYLETAINEAVDWANLPGGITSSGLHTIYEALHIPEFAYEPFDKAIMAQIEDAPLDSIASSVATSLTGLFLTGLSYLLIFIIGFIVLRLIVWVICLILKKGKSKPTMLSRLLGLALGAAKAFAICWVISLVANLLISSGSDWSNYLANSIGLGQEGFGIAKWFITTDLGYTAVMNFFLG